VTVLDERPVRTPFVQRLDELRRGPLALVVWITAAISVFFLLERRQQGFEFLGLAQSLEAEVSTDFDGRLAELLVAPFDQVASQQPIARLDDGLLQARIESARGAIAELQARVETVRAELALDHDRELRTRADELRRFQLDEEARRLERLELAVGIEADLVERDRLDLALERTRELVAKGIASEAELDDLRLLRQRVDVTVRESRRLAAALDAAASEADERRRAYEADAPELLAADPWVEPLTAAVRAEVLRVEELGVQRRSLTLTAPFGGQVSRVLAAPGQALLAGEPVAFVADGRAGEVLAYVPEAALHSVREGTRVVVARRDDPSREAEALVARLGPMVEQLPARLWLDPNFPEYGRPALVAGVAGLALAPGEVALIRLLD
jgi:multidrug resistance efflux pump